MDSRFEMCFAIENPELLTTSFGAVTWEFETFWVVGKGEMLTCQNCGHDIKRIFIIKSNAGRRMMVGSECVKLLCGDDDEQRDMVAKLARRATRAASQHRKGVPAINIGETREQYIARRVAEMGNSMKAYNAWTEFKHRPLTNRREKVNARARRMMGVVFDKRTEWYKGNAFPFTPFMFNEHDQKRIARKFHANPYDFTRQIWEVTSL